MIFELALAKVSDPVNADVALYSGITSMDLGVHSVLDECGAVQNSSKMGVMNV